MQFFLSALLTGYILEAVYHPPAFVEWLVLVEAGPALLVPFKEIFVRRFFFVHDEFIRNHVAIIFRYGTLSNQVDRIMKD